MNRCHRALLTVSLGVGLAAATLFAASAPAAAAGKKRALLVGIDAYGGDWKRLSGAGNDVRALEAELVRRGFVVKTLVDRAATREGIVRAFREHLIAGAGAGDVVMFHFSGHGQQVPDDDGDEVEGYDESLVPFDHRGTSDGSNNLRDDELGALLSEVAGKVDQVVVTLDACHSGTGTRGVYAVRGGPPAGPPAETRGGARDDGAMGLGDKAAGWVVLAAARPDELAAETRDPDRDVVVGAFSHGLVRALRAAGPQTTWRQVMDRVSVGILATTQTQHPQIEGDRDRRVFAGGWVAPTSYTVARPADASGRVPIEAGVLHGLVVGSELGLYPLGAERLDDDAPVVRVRVETVEATLAYARPIDPPTGEAAQRLLAEGAQVLELVTPASPRKLRLAVSDAAAKRIVSALPFVTLAGAGAGAWDVQLEAQGGALRAVSADGAEVGFPRGPEQPMDKELSRSDVAFEARLVQALELHWRRARVATLVNDDARQALPVSLALHRVDARVTDGGVVIDRDHGPLDAAKAVVHEGDVVQLRVKNPGSERVYVTILALATDGGIVVWYPDALTAPVDTALGPGEERRIDPPFVVTPPAGDAVYKLVATTTPVDLGGLTRRVQSGGTRGSDHPVALMLEEVASPTRARPSADQKKDRWGTDEARVRVE